MMFFKTLDNGYISGIGTGSGGIEITESEYSEILAVIRNKPTARDGYDHRLKTDLTWEEYELPHVEPEPPTDEDKAEAYDILMGVNE